MHRPGLQLAFALLTLAAPSAPAQSTTTLRVYPNLIQIPVLVTTHLPDPVPDLHFAVNLDSGPAFPISHVRLEGDDPITLAIVIDVSGGERMLLPKLEPAIASLASGPLTPRDRISIYAVDCELVRTADNIPIDPATLLQTAHAAITSTAPHGFHRDTPTCHAYLRLWDSLLYVTDQLSQRSGRRVILAITSGQDEDSKHSWSSLKNFAGLSAVSIFGLTEPLPNLPAANEPPLRLICAASGGEILSTGGRHLPETLASFIQILRQRYIVQFPRPDTLSDGPHDIRVDITGSKGQTVSQARIRPAGIAVPLADPAILADPDTIHTDPANAPTLGNRRILVAPQ